MHSTRTDSARRFIHLVANEAIAANKSYTAFFQAEWKAIVDNNPELIAMQSRWTTLRRTRPHNDPSLRELDDKLDELQAELAAKLNDNLSACQAREKRIHERLHKDHVEGALLPLLLRELDRFNAARVSHLPPYVVGILTRTICRDLERE
jgi:exonuclease VII large subunit